MATVHWLAWKLELTVNDLLQVLSLIDTQDGKQKDRCHVSNIAPPDRFRSTHSSTYSKQQVTYKNMKMTTMPLQVSGGQDGCGNPQLLLVRGKASANNVATTTVVTAEDVKLEGATEMVNGASIFIHSIKTGAKEPRECIEDIVTQCNDPTAKPGPKSTSKYKINSAKFHKSSCFESGRRVVLITHHLGTLEASQHIYSKRPDGNKCSNSNFDMTCPESTCLTMKATHAFTPPNKPSKRGKLLETVADRNPPAPQIQHSEHRVFFTLLLASLMSVSTSSDLLLDISVTHIRAASKHGCSISRQWTSNDCLSSMLGVDPQERFVVIPHKKHCYINLQVGTVHHVQDDVVYVGKREWCIKETATAALTKKTQNMPSKSR
jgi:hypothetical protein